MKIFGKYFGSKYKVKSNKKGSEIERSIEDKNEEIERFEVAIEDYNNEIISTREAALVARNKGLDIKKYVIKIKRLQSKVERYTLYYNQLDSDLTQLEDILMQPSFKDSVLSTNINLKRGKKNSENTMKALQENEALSTEIKSSNEAIDTVLIAKDSIANEISKMDQGELDAIIGFNTNDKSSTVKNKEEIDELNASLKIK